MLSLTLVKAFFTSSSNLLARLSLIFFPGLFVKQVEGNLCSLLYEKEAKGGLSSLLFQKQAEDILSS